MVANDAVALRLLELRLMRCSIPSDHPSPVTSPSGSDLHSLVNKVVTLIESGHYIKALSSSKTIFSDFSLSPDIFYTELLPDCVRSFFLNNNNNNNNNDGVEQDSVLEMGYRALLLMAFGVAALLAFTQCNVTGPQEKLTCMPLEELFIIKDDVGDGTWMQWDVWAHTELMSVGSDLRGKFSNLQYLIFAKTVMQRTKDLLFERFTSQTDGVRSITWWLGRVLFLQQRLLDERSSHLFDLLQVFKQETLFHFGTLKNIECYWGMNEDCSTVLSMLHIELGIMELFYGRVDAFRVHFDSAAEVTDYNFFVSGALGYRTVHQVVPKAQLRLVRGTKIDAGAQLTQESSTSDHSLLQQSNETSEASDVLMAPRFVADERPANGEQDVQNHDISAPQLKAIHQVMILAECISIQKRARDDEMQKWEMAPYIEAVDSQNTLSFILRYFCDILRVRWESTRSKTKQRSLLMMEKLVQGIYDIAPGVSKRIYYSFGLNIPTIPALRKEYADLLVSCGLTGEAVQIYEDLELWDNLIYCYQLMDKKTAAVDLIKTRLTEKPSDPRLWCSLGDVINDDSSYEKALEVSGQRSARAFRSLARSAYNRGDFEKSKALWESAMSLNSMHPDGWFALGAAALRSRDVDKALDAFTRAVQLDPDHGEAWNNIACLHMIKKRSKESYIAFKEALKLKRDSWQMWENFSHVAADVENYRQAMEAVMMILDMSKMKRIDCVLLERIMVEIEDRVNLVDDHAEESTSRQVDSAKTRETEHLTQLMGQILKKIVQSGGNSESWGLYARWHKLKGDLTMCSEALLKQVRSYQGSDLWKDKDRFVKFARASLELCKVYQELAFRRKSRKELFAAEMHLKSTIKQAVNFSDTEEFGELVVCLEEVQGSLKALT